MCFQCSGPTCQAKPPYVKMFRSKMADSSIFLSVHSRWTFILSCMYFKITTTFPVLLKKWQKTGTSNLFSSPEAWPFSLCHHFFSVGPGTFKGSGTVYCTLYSILLSPWPSDSNTNFVFSVPSGTCMVGPWLERSLSRLSVATTTRGSALSSRNPILLPHWLEAIDGWKERRHEPIRASETERVTAERTREKGETDAWTLTR